jgi:hypothetical protein
LLLLLLLPLLQALVSPSLSTMVHHAMMVNGGCGGGWEVLL